MFASRALVVAWMAMHLTGHSDYVTSFCDPVLLPSAIGQFSEAGMHE